MSAALSVVSPPGSPDRELARELAQSKGRLFGLIGVSQLAAVATEDFRREVRAALAEGKLTLEHFDELDLLLRDELEGLSAVGEQLFDEQMRAVLP